MSRGVRDDIEKFRAREVDPLAATKRVLAERERELLLLKGHCSNTSCTLHYAHSGPCR